MDLCYDRRAALPEMRMRRPAVLLLVATCLAAAAHPAAAPGDSFLVAVVRDDGVVLPIAAHDRGRWRTPWPGPAREAEVPVRVEDCPLAWWGLPAAPREWTLHVPGESPRPIGIDGVTWVLTHCQQQVALVSRAGARDTLRPADGMRAPKHGVAVTGQARVTLPRSVDPESPEGRSLLDALQVAFNREERLMLASDYFAVYRPALDGSQRDRMPVRALGLYEGPARVDGPVYFVELQRRYPRKAPERLQWCDEVTYMTGWAHPGADGRLELSLISNDVTSCLLDTVVRATPRAVLDSPQGPVWLVEEYRPDAEAFSLYLAPDRDGAQWIARRFAGSCAGSPSRPERPVEPPPDNPVP